MKLSFNETLPELYLPKHNKATTPPNNAGRFRNIVLGYSVNAWKIPTQYSGPKISTSRAFKIYANDRRIQMITFYTNINTILGNHFNRTGMRAINTRLQKEKRILKVLFFDLNTTRIYYNFLSLEIILQKIS